MSDAEKLISSHYKMARLWAGYDEMCSASIKWKIGKEKKMKRKLPVPYRVLRRSDGIADVSCVICL